MACLRGPPTLAQHKKLRKLVVVRQSNHGLWVAQAWPGPSGPRSLSQLDQQSLFAQWAAAAKIAWIGDYLQSREIAQDSGWYPRDVQIRAFAGNLITFVTTSGDVYSPRRLAPPNPPPPVEEWPVLISKQVVAGSPAASITFSSIPQTYNELALVMSVRSTDVVNADSLRLQVNGDTGANYDWLEQYSYNSGGSIDGAISDSAATICTLSGADSPSETTGTARLLIPNYVGTTNYKAGICDGLYIYNTSSGGMNSFRRSFQWKNAAAITSMTLFAAGGDLAVGSYIALYGW